MIARRRCGARRLLERIPEDLAVTRALRIDPVVELRGASNVEAIEEWAGVHLHDTRPLFGGVRALEVADVAVNLRRIERELRGTDHDAVIAERLAQLVDRLLQCAAAGVVGVRPE